MLFFREVNKPFMSDMAFCQSPSFVVGVSIHPVRLLLSLPLQ